MSRKLFTAGCVVLILLGLVHLLGHYHLVTSAGSTEHDRQVITGMKSDPRDMGLGMKRAIFDFLAGLSLAFTVLSLGMGVAGFVVRSHAASAPGLLRQVAFAYAGTWTAMTGVGLYYLFPAPLAFIIPTALLFAAAGLTAPRS